MIDAVKERGKNVRNEHDGSRRTKEVLGLPTGKIYFEGTTNVKRLSMPPMRRIYIILLRRLLKVQWVNRDTIYRIKKELPSKIS